MVTAIFAAKFAADFAEEGRSPLFEMWTSALGQEQGATSFAHKALGGLVYDPADNFAEDPAAENVAEKMEQSDDDDEGGDAQDEEPVAIMPEPQCILGYSTDKRYVEFPAQRIARTCPVLSPQVLNGLYAIRDLSLSHKEAVSAVLTLPMLVCASPAVAFCMRKVTMDRSARGSAKTVPRVTAIQSWFMSAASARQLVLAANEGLIPFHANIKPEFLRSSMQRFEHQLSAYEKQVFGPGLREATTLDQFVACAEAMGFFYLHLCEEFLFRTLIEPHCGTAIELAHVLTPRTTFSLVQCATQQSQEGAVRCAHDFFAFKLSALRREYSDEFPSVSLPAASDGGGVAVYKGLVTEQTLQEYWQLCKYICL